MTTFNKILNPMYSVIAAYSKQEDGSINAKYGSDRLYAYHLGI